MRRLAGWRPTLVRVALVAVAIAGTTSRLGAQQAGPDSLAVVHGRVIDAGTGAVVAGAQVLLTGPVAMAPAIHRDTLITDARGAWRSGRLSPGRYHLRVRAIAYVAREMELDVAAAESHHTTVLTAAVQPLERVVVTAARREQQLKDVAIATDIVSREDIERTGASDLASVLIEQTGIHLQGGHPAGAGVMLQGHGSERVLVLLDGQPMVGRISGVFDVSRIPTAAVERIEVVKGPQSTLYGSEAIGGVVNIITRTPPKNLLGASAEITAGTQERREGTVGITYGRGSIASSLDVSRRTTETTPGLAQTGGALAARTDVAAKLQWARDTVLSLEASVLALDERERWRTGTFYNFSDNVQWSGRMAAGWKLGRHRLTPTLFASVFDHRSRGSSEPKPIAGDTGQRQVQRLYQAELLYNVSLGEAAAHALDVGLTVRRDETETARVDGGVRSLTSVEPFAQLELAPTAALSVVPGVRVSHNTQWGTHVTPRLAARYHATESLTLRASAGSGYRAPDFKELYMFFQNQAAGYAVVGNLDLRPETSRNLTAGAEWTGARVYLRGELFWNEFRDFIETRPITGPDEPPVFQYRNVDNGATRGIEVEAGASLRALRVEGAYSALATRNRATGRPLLGRPAHSARSTLSYATPFGARASLSAIFTGRTAMQRDEVTGAVTSWRDAFVRADVRLAQRLPGGLGLIIGADNLFDRQPAEWAGFTGRHVYGGLSWTARRDIEQ